MTPDHARGVTEFLRKYIRLIADFNALSSTLDTYENRGEPPHDWRAFWADLQTSDEYQGAIQAFEPLDSRSRTSEI